MKTEHHKTLKRQIKRLGLVLESVPDMETWMRLLDMVSASYHQSQQDRYLMERSLEQMSTEMSDMVQQLKQESLRTTTSQRDRLQSIINGMSEGLITFDTNGLIESLNPIALELMKQPESALIHQPLFQYLQLAESYSGQTTQDTFERIWRGLQRKIPLKFEHALLLKQTGESVDVSCTIGPLILDNALKGGVIAIRDTRVARRHEDELIHLNAALREARDRAMASNQSKSTFLANMSHELRTPLNAIIGYSELIGEDAEEDGLQHIMQDAEKIRISADHLLNIINDILDISKIEAGKMELSPEPFLLSTFLASIDDTVSQLARLNNNTFTIRAPNHKPSLFTDKKKLLQCVLNLLSNAAKFTTNGTIELVVEFLDINNQRMIQLTIKDTGIGIPAEKLESLFDAFTQADQSTTRKYGGTGLGLSITKRFATMLKGNLSVESTPGQGSTFSLIVPMSLNEKETEISTVISEIVEQSGLGPSIILAIDDDNDIHHLLSRFLPEDEFQILHATSGAAGIEIAKKIKPDVITLDVMMPEMDGWSVLHALKSHPALSDIPVVMLSLVQEHERGFSLGAVDYLTKPIDRRRLLNILRKHCDNDAHILIVEDDTNTRQILDRVLSQQGYFTSTAEHGRAAMSILEQTIPEMILLDLMMPYMDGFQVIDKLNASPHWSNIPVIVLTAMDLDDEAMMQLQSRTTQVFQKGITSTEVLVSEIKALLTNKTNSNH